MQGAVPKLVGLPLSRAEARLQRLHLKWKLDGDPPAGAKVVSQTPRWGLAAKRGLTVTLVVAGGSGT
jgi:beta-lactam-binding protein with PASTA domain